jgi:nucleotide-binding universal stress UspA family protein
MYRSTVGAADPQSWRLVVVTIDQVICPVDLSRASASALRHAAAWARWYDAPLRVLHAAPLPQILVDGSGQTVILDTRSLEDVRADVLRFVAATLPAQPMPTVNVVEGHAVTAILDEAGRWPHALIIMGTHGSTGLERALIGSVTERVAHATACPLLVVPPRDTTEPSEAIELTRIVCAVDFRPSSLAALRYALSLARQGRQRLELVTVLEAPGFLDALTLDDERERRTAARDALRDRVPDATRQTSVIHEEVLRGAPADALLRHAGDVQAELIVMGSGDRRHLHALWLGSTTGRLMRSAGCPILIVPPPPRFSVTHARPVARRDWNSELARVSLAYQGEPAALAVVRDDLGTQREAFGLPFIGVTADLRDGVDEVAVMLGKADGTHLTHVIAHARDIRVSEPNDGHDLELVIVAGDGSTTLLMSVGSPREVCDALHQSTRRGTPAGRQAGAVRRPVRRGRLRTAARRRAGRV